MSRFVGAGLLASFLSAGLTAQVAAGEPVRHVPHKQVGKASVYSSRLQGRHMTDGERFNIHSNAAASKTLPIGTKARVTDLKTGKSAEVTVKDRGPVPKDRVMDLTPHTAREIGLTRKEGVAPVAIVPTSIPSPGARTTEAAAARP